MLHIKEQEDALEKSLTNPTEQAMPLFDKTKCNGDASYEIKDKDMLEFCINTSRNDSHAVCAIY